MATMMKKMNKWQPSLNTRLAQSAAAKTTSENTPTALLGALDVATTSAQKSQDSLQKMQAFYDEIDKIRERQREAMKEMKAHRYFQDNVFYTSIGTGYQFKRYGQTAFTGTATGSNWSSPSTTEKEISAAPKQETLVLNGRAKQNTGTKETSQNTGQYTDEKVKKKYWF